MQKNLVNKSPDNKNMNLLTTVVLLYFRTDIITWQKTSSLGRLWQNELSHCKSS